MQNPQQPAPKTLRTSVYVDGFNLYRGALENTLYKWLDLEALFRSLLVPCEGNTYEITKIKYFTAHIKTSPTGYDGSRQRQLVYIEALKAHSAPKLEVILGKFEQEKKKRALVGCPYCKAEIIERKEKGSDVNLTSNLINDAWCDRYDCAVVVSTDGDMAEAMKLVSKHHPNKELILAYPESRGRPDNLLQWASRKKKIKEEHLKASQLPECILGKKLGTTIKKPAAWNYATARESGGAGGDAYCYELSVNCNSPARRLGFFPPSRQSACKGKPRVRVKHISPPK